MKSAIYFAECQGHIKIGFSRDVRGRMRGLGAGNPHPINVIATLPGGRAMERRIHNELAAHRVKNEWFADCPDVRNAIEKYKKIAAEEGYFLEIQEAQAWDLVRDIATAGPSVGLNLWDVSQRFSRLINLDLLDQISDARASEKKLGLPRGSLMDKIIRGDARRKQFTAAVGLMLDSYDKFGKILDQCDRELGSTDISHYFAVAEHLISAVEAAYEPFTGDSISTIRKQRKEDQ